MKRVLLQRVADLAVVLFGISVIVFLMIRLIPGDAVAIMLGANTEVTPERIAEMRARIGLDRPLVEQYVSFVGRALQGDLGQSIFLNRPVTQAIIERAEPTLLLTMLALIVAISIGLPLGIVAALRRGRWEDTGAMFVAIGGVSMPTFWLGLNLIYLFGVQAKVLPVAGYQPLSAGLGDNLRYLVMPAITLGLAQGALLARMTRSMMLETLNEDYVRTARAKGIPERQIMIRHVLRNSLIPIVTLWGLDFGGVVGGGAILTETVFDLQGVGQYAAEAVGQLDVPPVLATTLFAAFFIVLLNAVVDIVYAYLDPRIRLQ